MDSEVVRVHTGSSDVVHDLTDTCRRFVSSYVWIRISTFGPRTWRLCAFSARPFRQASVLDGMAERSHWIG